MPYQPSANVKTKSVEFGVNSPSVVNFVSKLTSLAPGWNISQPTYYDISTGKSVGVKAIYRTDTILFFSIKPNGDIYLNQVNGSGSGLKDLFNSYKQTGTAGVYTSGTIDTKIQLSNIPRFVKIMQRAQDDANKSFADFYKNRSSGSGTID